MAGLDRLFEEVRWRTPEEAIAVREPLLVSALASTEDPAHFRAMIGCRSAEGLGTLVVPRFRQGDLRDMLGSPEPIEVVPAEFESLWYGDRVYRVPGSVAFRTNLPTEKLSSLPGSGALIMEYRPSIVRGSVILCSAAITGRRPGTNVEDQRALLETLLARTAVAASVAEEDRSPEEEPAALPAERLLETGDELAPVVLLGLLRSLPDRDPKVVARCAEEWLRVDVGPGDAAQVLARLDGETSASEIELALRRAGWGAFLRRLGSPRLSRGAD